LSEQNLLLRNRQKKKMKFTIFKRLTFGYGTILLLVVFLGAYVTLKLNQLNELAREISSVHATGLLLTEHLLDNLLSQVGFEKKYLISKDHDFFIKFWEKRKQVIEAINKLAELMQTEENKTLLSEVKTQYENYLLLFQVEVETMGKDPDYSRRKFQEQKDRCIDQISMRIKNLTRHIREHRDQKIAQSNQISSQVLRVTMITTGMAVLIGLLISFYNTRSINRSILLLQKKTKEIAKGNFEKIHNISSPPEIKELADDFNLMSERLRELDEMKKDFISHVSHTLRTPLTAMKEASCMLLEGTYVDVPAKQHELLSISKKECERLIDSVNRILDLSRMEAKMMDYQLKQCRLFPVIQRTVLNLAPIAQRKNIDLELKPAADLPPIRMDGERIGQVMENVIGNALKFSAAGGKVVITAVLKNSAKQWIEICVSDTGCGIPEENLEKIFDRFKRIDSGRETTLGTGLGLSIAKYIIADHGGKIWAQSEPGKGSRFFFTLPVP
jgi:two-component system sensor histidine kinase GlrK